MTSIKIIRNWTPEDRSKVRLMVRQLNGVIDSLNYKYWRYKDIAYRERRLTYLTELKKEHQENINNLRKRGEYIYFEIKRLENQYNKPSAEVQKYINILKNKGFYPTPFLNLNAKPVGLKKYYKSIVRDIENLKKELDPIYDQIKCEQNYIKQIDQEIKKDCSGIETERTKRNKIKQDYKKQLIEEYNNLVTRLNNIAGYQGNPIIRIEPPTTFYELPRAQYWMFHVTEEMEEVSFEQ